MLDLLHILLGMFRYWDFFFRGSLRMKDFLCYLECSIFMDSVLLNSRPGIFFSCSFSFMILPTFFICYVHIVPSASLYSTAWSTSLRDAIIIQSPSSTISTLSWVLTVAEFLFLGEQLSAFLRREIVSNDLT